jgi:hypothetical protein
VQTVLLVEKSHKTKLIQGCQALRLVHIFSPLKSFSFVILICAAAAFFIGANFAHKKKTVTRKDGLFSER